MSKFSLDTWTHEFPTEENVGQWFIKKHDDGKYPPVYKIVEVCLHMGFSYGLHLCEPCNSGIQKTSMGMRLEMFNPEYTSFCGPIEMPADFAKIRAAAKDVKY